MPRARKSNHPVGNIPTEEVEGVNEDMDTGRAGSRFKLIAEMIADTDVNLPKEQIDRDIARFSEYSDVSDWKGIPKFFESLSSLSRRASDYDNWKNRFKLVDYLVSCFGCLKDSLIQYLATVQEAKANGVGQSFQPDTELVHATCMFCIIVQRLTVQLQLYVSKTTAAAAHQAKRGGSRNRHLDLDEDICKWKEVQRKRMINCLIELLELRVETGTGSKKGALNDLFYPEGAGDPHFISRFVDFVRQLFEDPENAARASQQWIIQYLGIWKVLAVDFHVVNEIVISFLNDTMSQNYLESASSFPFIEPLVHLTNEKEDNLEKRKEERSLHAVLSIIVNRACRAYTGSRVSYIPPKAYCMAIQGFALHLHDIMLQELPNVCLLLHNPHANVRISTLQGMADMFSSPFLSQTLCEEFESRKKKRMVLFKKIVAHTNDEATNVRAKAVSLLKILMENRRIPEEFESIGFLSIVGSRIEDKSVQVRKAAIQFFTYFLDNNRHGHDFNRQDHMIKLDAKTKELRLAESPENRMMDDADRYLSSNQYNLRQNMKREIIAYLNKEIDLGNIERPSISALFETITDSRTAPNLLRYYAMQDIFPFKHDQGYPPLKSDSDTVGKVFGWVFEHIKEDYIHYKVQMSLQDDDQLLETEQQVRDKLHAVLQLRAQIQQLVDKMSIEMEISECVPKALRCVLMGETAEIKEGIRFLTRCKLFEITGADEAIRSMCSLVWRPGSEVLNELIEAAEDMFISRLDGNQKASERDKSTVENLMKAMNGVTDKDRPSVEEVIFLLADAKPAREDEERSKTHRKRRTIETNVITRLWTIALDSMNGDPQKKIDALRILYPISKTERGIPEARARLRSLQKKLTEEPQIAVEALRIISILSTPTQLETGDAAVERPIFRIHQDDSLFVTIEKLFFHEVVKANDDPKRDWFGIIRLTIKTMLHVSMDVNVMLPRLAAQFLYRAQKISEFYIFYSKQAENSQDNLERENAKRRGNYWAVTWCRVMEKLMAFCGEVAVQLHAYAQVTIPKLNKRYNMKMVAAEDNDSNVRAEPIRFLSDLEKSIASRKTIFAVQRDFNASTAEVVHLTSIMCEKRLFVPHRLLGRLLPIVVYAMRVKTMPLRIKQAAMVAYGKFMPISSEVAAFAAPAFFSAMVHSASPLVRCNLIAACCDFAFSQPTLFELYSPSLFRMSQDISAAARESTILVLSYLISNDMIQTRGVLSEPARCICDDVYSVREAAQSFFKELSSRSDVIMQLLPEFLYRLSCTRERMPFKSYKTVFEFLIQLFKDKNKTHMDSMIDRVCLKFSSIDMSDSESPRYLLVALAKFAQNEGGLTRLHDNWRHWSKFLCHPNVAREYKAMLESMGNSSKNEDVKLQCAELVANITKIQEEGLRKEDVTASASTKKRGGRGRKAVNASRGSPSAPAAGNPRRKRQAVTLSPEESEVSDCNSD